MLVNLSNEEKHTTVLSFAPSFISSSKFGRPVCGGGAAGATLLRAGGAGGGTGAGGALGAAVNILD